MFVKTHKDLFERLKRMVLQKATTSADSLGVAARGGSSGARALGREVWVMPRLLLLLCMKLWMAAHGLEIK